MTELRQLFFPSPSGSRTLVILLPGAYNRASDFVDNGFVEALHQRRIAADVIAADVSEELHGLEYRFLDLMRVEIVFPAKARGYDQIWLAGISLGGYAAMAYAATFETEVSGVLAIAPYLSRRVLKEIRQCGGLSEWRTTYRPEGLHDLPKDVWRWLVDGPSIDMHLCFGEDDRFAEAHRLAATLLDGRSFSRSGGHDWPTWRNLWTAWLDLGHLILPLGRGPP